MLRSSEIDRVRRDRIPIEFNRRCYFESSAFRPQTKAAYSGKKVDDFRPIG